MTGHFDNKEQFTEMKEAGKIFPYAQHVNTVCNDKIKNIPEDFTGIFIVEESYYETAGRRHASPHLFLITDNNDKIMLSSYEIPEGAAILQVKHKKRTRSALKKHFGCVFLLRY